MITLACDKTRWVQNNYNIKTVWALPPSFERDIFNGTTGTTMYHMCEKYLRSWMEAYPKLKYVSARMK